jgi:hypothetical protein
MRGGETAMWGEGINEDNFDEYVWRGAGAAAERLWSPYNLTASHVAANDRFVEHLCRLSLLGVRGGPIQPSFCPADSLPPPPYAAAALAALEQGRTATGGQPNAAVTVTLTAAEAHFIEDLLRAASSGAKSN